MKTDSQDELGNGKKVVAEADLKHALKEALKDIRKFEKLLSFRLIFYSIVAASVLSTIPFTFKVGVSYLLFISIILFIAIIETFLRLDEGDYITNITPNLVLFIFLFDIFFILGTFMLSASFLSDYADFITGLSGVVHLSMDELTENYLHVDKVEPIAVLMLILFVLLLVRGWVDRQFIKDTKTIKTHWALWGTTHTLAVAICLVVLFFLHKIDEQYSRIIDQDDVIADLVSLPNDSPFVEGALQNYPKTESDTAGATKRKAIVYSLNQSIGHHPEVIRAIVRYSLDNPNGQSVSEVRWYLKWIFRISLASLILVFVYLFIVYSKIITLRFEGTLHGPKESS